MRHLVNERAIALVGVLVALMLLMGLATTLAVMVNLDTQILGTFGRGVRGFYAAEAGLNKGMADTKTLFMNFAVPHGTDLDEQSFQLGSREVVYQLTERPGNPRVVTIPAGELFAGLNSIEYTYTVVSESQRGNAVEASVGAEFNVSNIPLFQFVAFYAEDLEILPGPNMELNGRVHTNGDLYLNAEASLTIADKPSVGVSAIQVTCAGDIYRGRKNSMSTCNGTVTVDKLEDVQSPTPDFDPQVLACNGGTRRVPISELATWKGSMVSQIQSISIPKPDLIARGSGEFWEKADLRIGLLLGTPGGLCAAPACPQRNHSIAVLDQGGGVDVAKTTSLLSFMRDTVWNQANSSMRYTMPIFYTDVPLIGSCGCADGSSDQSGCQSQDKDCYSERFASDYRTYDSDMRERGTFREARRGGYYNYREKKWIYLLNVNISDLIAWNGAYGEPLFDNDDRTDGGLVIFLTVVGGNSSGINNYGVRVFGSPNLSIPYDPVDPTGLTVVSDQAMYVAGDYNRGPLYAGDRPKQPAALIGDSVNVMSNNWLRQGCNYGCAYNDRQSRNPSTGGTRQAATTVINSAFLGGVDRTGGANGTDGQNGSYNGGLENYPRFHERWTGVALNYQGSFVSLGIPEHVNGGWLYGDPVYQAPQRNWNYDPDFNTVEKLPPLTPRFVYVRQVLFTQNFR